MAVCVGMRLLLWLAAVSQLRVLYRSSSSGLDWPKSMREGSGLKLEPSVASLEASGVDVSSEEDADSTGTAFIVSGPELAGSDGLASVDTSPEACFLSDASWLSTGAGSSSEGGADTFSVLVSVGAWLGDISVAVTDDSSSVMTVTMGSSEIGSADFTSVSEIVELWAEVSVVELGCEVSSAAGGSRFAAIADCGCEAAVSLATGSVEASSEDAAARLHCPAA